jgi:hypothetical protein
MKIADLVLYSLIMFLFNIFSHKSHSFYEMFYDSLLFTFSKWIDEIIIYSFNLRKLVEKNDIKILLFDSITHDFIYELLIYFIGNDLERNKQNYENMTITLLSNYIIEHDSKIFINFINYFKNLFSRLRETLSFNPNNEQLKLLNENIDLLNNYDTKEIDFFINSLPNQNENQAIIKLNNIITYDLNEFIFNYKPSVEFIYYYSKSKSNISQNTTYISYYDNYKTYHNNVLIIFCDYSIDFISDLLNFIHSSLILIKNYIPAIKYIDYTLLCLSTIKNAYIYTTTTLFQPEHYFSIISMCYIILMRVNVLTARLSMLFNTIVLINSYSAYKDIIKYFLDESNEFISKTYNEEKYINKKFPKKPKFLEKN